MQNSTVDNTRTQSALGDLRVLDLADERGLYCTKLLADLGADVIKIEPPTGAPIRNMAPFHRNRRDPEKSLRHFHYDANKKSITLNIDKDEGAAILRKLVKTADILVESRSPGFLASMGLGYPALKEINPGIILVSVTGFGQDGPYKDYKACDLTGLAMSGLLYTLGFPEDPPTMLYGYQSYHMSGAYAAIGALMALFHRDICREGQWIDVSQQAATLRLSEMVAYTYWLTGSNRKRSGLEYYRGIRDIFPCKDGYVVCSALGGAGAEKILQWMESKGMAADLREEKYKPVIEAMMSGSPLSKGSQEKSDMRKSAKRLRELKEQVNHIEGVWEDFLMTHTREELFVGAQERGVRLMPVNDVQSIVNDIGLKARQFFKEVEHPDLEDTLIYPGPPYRFSETPWRISKRAPLLGENNKEIYQGELGLSDKQLSDLKNSGII